jgi:hypothetical protein
MQIVKFSLKIRKMSKTQRLIFIDKIYLLWLDPMGLNSIFTKSVIQEQNKKLIAFKLAHNNC